MNQFFHILWSAISEFFTFMFTKQKPSAIEPEMREPKREMKDERFDPMLWKKDIGAWRKQIEKRRIARLINKYGLKYWDIGGVKILALNKKNAYRKYLNLQNGLT